MQFQRHHLVNHGLTFKLNYNERCVNQKSMLKKLSVMSRFSIKHEGFDIILDDNRHQYRAVNVLLQHLVSRRMMKELCCSLHCSRCIQRRNNLRAPRYRWRRKPMSLHWTLSICSYAGKVSSFINNLGTGAFQAARQSKELCWVLRALFQLAFRMLKKIANELVLGWMIYELLLKTEQPKQMALSKQFDGERRGEMKEMYWKLQRLTESDKTGPYFLCTRK